MDSQEFITSTSIIFRTGNGKDVVMSKDKIARHSNSLLENVNKSFVNYENIKKTAKSADEVDKENNNNQDIDEEDYNDDTIDAMLLDFLESDIFEQQVISQLFWKIFTKL